MALKDRLSPQPRAVLVRDARLFLRSWVEPMMDTWRKFRRLNANERGIVLEAAAALPVAWIALRIAGAGIRKAALARAGFHASATAAGSNASSELAEAQRIARLQAATARNFFLRATCLEQSLVLRWMLRRRGMTPVLCIGARKEANQFEAHAWVELNGTALEAGEAPHPHFVPFRSRGESMETQTD